MMPKIFIGSSVESLPIARAIQYNLDYDAFCDIWNDGTFKLSKSSLESLIDSLEEFDFAIFILNPEDYTELRGDKVSTVRDNVIFELGLFYGRLGRERVFSVVPRTSNIIHLPTDLLGITKGSYDPQNPNKNSALGPFCEQVRTEIKRLVPMPILPISGINGLNILDNGTILLNRDVDYSLTTSNPRNLTLKVRIISKNKENKEGYWTYRLGSHNGWNISPFDHTEYIQTFISVANSQADMQISFVNSGNATIEFYRNNESAPFRTKEIGWN